MDLAIFYRLRKKMYHILEGGYYPWDRIAEAIIMILILLNVILFVVSTIESVSTVIIIELNYVELFCVLIFTAEFALRVWVSVEDKKCKRYGPIFGRLRYLVSVMTIIDLIAIFPYWIGFIFFWVRLGTPFIDGIAFLSAVRIIRLFHLFRFKKYIYAVKILKAVLKNNMEVLITTFVYALTLLLVTATALYYAERKTAPEVSTFPSIPAAMYASILVLTGNYGTSQELGVAGRWVVAIGAMFSIFLIAVPTAVLAWGFDTKERYKEHKAKKDRVKKSLKKDILSEIKAAGLDLEGSDEDDEDNSDDDETPIVRKDKSHACPHCKRPY